MFTMRNFYKLDELFMTLTYSTCNFLIPFGINHRKLFKENCKYNNNVRALILCKYVSNIYLLIYFIIFLERIYLKYKSCLTLS